MKDRTRFAKFLFSLGSLITAAYAAEAPPVHQLFRAGAGAHEGQGIAIMADGNIVATGQFAGSATFGSTTLASGGSFDYFLAAYSANGGNLWAVGAGATGADFGQKVIVDRDGNIVVAGVLQGPLDFHGTQIQGFGLHDWFLAKYTPAGALVWVRIAGSTAADQASDVAQDGDGNYLVSGRIRGVATFGDSATVGAASQTWCVLAKYDSNGNFVWVRQVAQVDTTSTSGVAADAAGNVFVTSLITTSGQGPFLAKYNSAGTQQWIWIAGTGYGYFEEGSSVDFDAAGNTYVAGRFSATSLTLGNTTLANPQGRATGFIAKFDPAGAPVWGIKGGARAFDVDAEADGTLHVTGFFNTGAPQVGSQSFPASTGMLHLYIAKISPAGEVEWVKPGSQFHSGIGRAVARHGASTFAIGEGSAELYGVETFPGGVFIAELREASAAPTLSAGLVGDRLQLSWPAEFQGYALETATAIDQSFGPAAVELTPVAGQPNTFTTPLPAADMFFRLRR